MTRKTRAKQKRRIGQLVVVALVLGGMIAAGWVISRRSASDTGSALRDTDTAFSVPTHVGQPAPEFTAIGVDGRPYTMTPGDGRPKALVFYMGFR